MTLQASDTEPQEQHAPEPLSQYPDMLTTRDLAKITGLSDQTIRAEATAGRLPCKKIGRTWYCSKRRFIEYMEA